MQLDPDLEIRSPHLLLNLLLDKLTPKVCVLDTRPFLGNVFGQLPIFGTKFIQLGQSVDDGQTAFKRNGVRNCTFHWNAAQPHPLNWFPCQNGNFNMVLYISNPEFEFMPLDGVQIDHYKFWKIYVWLKRGRLIFASILTLNTLVVKV